MKKIIFTFLIFAAHFNVVAQLVVNGDFENNTLVCTANCPCVTNTNMSNALFNSSMPYCYAFGSAGELDVQDSTCPYYSMPSHGRWFISLHTKPTGEVDALSMLIDPVLIAGNTYQLSYDEKTEIHVDNIDTLDTLLVGISNNISTFGSQIHSSQPMEQAGWTTTTFSFIPAVNTSYLTFKNQGNHRGWNFKMGDGDGIA